MPAVVHGEGGIARCAWGDSTPEYRAYAQAAVARTRAGFKAPPTPTPHSSV